MNSKNKFTTISFLFGVLILVGLTFEINFFNTNYNQHKINKNNIAVEDKSNTSTEDLNEKNKNQVTTTIKLAAVGDILIHDTVYNNAKITSSYNFKPMFKLIKPIVESADIAFANQESLAAGSELGYSGYPRFNGPYEIIDALKWTGFDVINMANNHTLDRGEKGVLNSTKYISTSGLKYIGAATSTKDKQKLRVIKKNNIKLSFLGYTYGTNGLSIPTEKDYLVNKIDVEEIKKDISKAEKESDVVVVSLHFGTQYQNQPNKSQEKLAQKLADSGADIILGHHPHVLQPIQWIQGDGDKTLVAYSLGNFISGQIGTERNIGGIMNVKIHKNQKTNKVKLDRVEFIPTYTSSKQNKNFKVVPLSGAGKYGLDQASQWRKSTLTHVLP